MENERLFHLVEAARQGEFELGADLSKKEGFSLKKHSDRAQFHFFAVSVCQNHVVSTIAAECHSALSTIALLQIFDLFFAGRRVATRFCDVTYVPYLLRILYLSVTMSPP